MNATVAECFTFVRVIVQSMTVAQCTVRQTTLSLDVIRYVKRKLKPKTTECSEIGVRFLVRESSPGSRQRNATYRPSHLHAAN